MQHITLSIEENRYDLLLQFLNTLDYVRIVPQPMVVQNGKKKTVKATLKKPFLHGMKTTNIPVSRTILNREEIYGDRI